MSTDGNTLDELEDEGEEAEEITPAKILRDRLSSVPDVVAKHGKPKKKSSPKKKAQANGGKSSSDTKSGGTKSGGTKTDDGKLKQECERRAPALLQEAQRIHAIVGVLPQEKSRLDTVKSDYELAAGQTKPDYKDVAAKLDDIETACQDVLKAKNDRSKDHYDDSVTRYKAKIQAHDGYVKNNGYAAVVGADGPCRDYLKHEDAISKAVAKSDYIVADDAMESLNLTATDLGKALKAHWAALERGLPDLDTVIADGVFNDVQQLITTYQSAAQNKTAIEADTKTLNWKAANIQNLFDLEAAAAALRKSRTDKLMGVKQGDLVAKAKEMAKSDPSAFVELVKEPAGRALLDSVMLGLKGSADSKGEKELCIAAIKARFGIQNLEGVLSSKAMPKLYEVMKIVPPTHTLGNPRLKTVKRERSDEGSFYKDDENLIVLNMQKQGTKDPRRELGTSSMDHDAGVPDEYFTGEKKDLDYFNWTTLHEVGHAVDAKMNWMDTQGKDSKYGGWLKHSVEEVADVAATIDNFYAKFPKYTQDTLKKYLLAVLQRREKQVVAATTVKQSDLAGDASLVEAEAIALKRKDKLKDAEDDVIAKFAKGAMKKSKEKDEAKRELLIGAIGHILKGSKPSDALDLVFKNSGIGLDDQTEWAKLDGAKAVIWCRAIRLKSTSKGLWDDGADAKKHEIGGRIYTQSYGTSWNSYETAARARSVSTYQFRSPYEWFAELYSAYYSKKLTAKHPDYDFFHNNVHKIA